MMAPLRRWLTRQRPGRRAGGSAYTDPFFTDPGLVEDDYRRLRGQPWPTPRGLPPWAAPRG
jgi:hypothetical protein